MSTPDDLNRNRHSADKEPADGNLYADDFEENDACSSRQSRRSDGTGDFNHGSGRTSVNDLAVRLSSRTYADAGSRRMAELRGAGGDTNVNTPVAMTPDVPARYSPRLVFDNSSDDPAMWDTPTLKERFLASVRDVQRLEVEAAVRKTKNKDEIERVRALGDEDVRRAQWKREEIERLMGAKAAYDTVIKDELKKLDCETIRNLEEQNQKENLRKQRMRTVKKGTLVAKELQTLNIPADKRDEYKSACATLNAQKDRQKVLTEKIDWYERKLLDIRNKNENSRPDTEPRTSPDGASLEAHSPPHSVQQGTTQHVKLLPKRAEIRNAPVLSTQPAKPAQPAQRGCLLPSIPVKPTNRDAARAGQGHGRKPSQKDAFFHPAPPSGSTGASLPELVGPTGGQRGRDRPGGRRHEGPGGPADKSRGKMLDITSICQIMKGDSELGRTPTPVIAVPPKRRTHYLPAIPIGMEDENDSVNSPILPGASPHVPHPPKGPKPKRRKGERRKH